MKMTINCWKNVRWTAAILCVSALPVVGTLVTGCAGDRYHESTGEGIDDAAITGRVKGLLGHDPVYKYDDVHVTTFKGTVQLSGFVASQDAKAHAEQLAKNADGARGVINDISLK